MERTTVNKRYRVDTQIGESRKADVILGHDHQLKRALAADLEPVERRERPADVELHRAIAGARNAAAFEARRPVGAGDR